MAGEASDELENTPRRVDTGNLKNSITHEVDEDEKAVYVGTNVEYGVYVHEGTVRMAPSRFLSNAVNRNKDQIKNFIESTIIYIAETNEIMLEHMIESENDD